MKQIPKYDSPEVSVLMSCYNASRWLQEAIDSVLAQTFRKFEFIMVDDGSTDDTWRIIQNFCKKDNRIVAISKKNTGLADSLNVGMAHARGLWIARFDQDDLCEPTRLEEQLNFVRNHPEVVLLGTGFLEIDEHNRVIKQHRYPSSPRKLARHLEHMKRFFPHSSAFFRLDQARQVKGYNPRIHRAEDRRLWLELSLQGEIMCLPKPLVQIRKHSGQMSLDNSGRRQLCDATAATICYFLLKNGAKDPSTDASQDEWLLFLNWVENRIDESGFFQRRKIWTDARAEYFKTEGRMTAALCFFIRLLQSGHIVSLIWEKFFGSSLAQQLARQWMAETRRKGLRPTNEMRN